MSRARRPGGFPLHHEALPWPPALRTMSSHLAPAFFLNGLGTRYSLYVERPPARSEGTGPDSSPSTVVLCLDGDDQFDTLRTARASLAGQPTFPDLLLVGIGYGASYRQPANRRLRDYTPCPIEGGGDGGGADEFLEFLRTEVWPELARRYPINHDVRGIAGHSLGALFGLHALFKPHPFFNRVLASAPSIWWGDRAILAQVNALQAKEITLTAQVFLGVGERDSESMRGDLGLLEAQLASKPFPALAVSRARFPGKDHVSSIDAGFRAGLEALFSGPVR